MDKNKALSSRDLAAQIGQSHTIVLRKRRQGKSDEQVIAEAAGEPVESVDGAETFADAQRRKEAALADLRELERDQIEGNLIDVELMERAWATAIKTVTGSLLALPDRRAPELSAMTDPRQVRDMLLGDIKQILSDLPAQIHETVKAAAAA